MEQAIDISPVVTSGITRRLPNTACDRQVGIGAISSSFQHLSEIPYDLDECAKIAAKRYKRPSEWCRTLLEERHEAGIITHMGVREQERLTAACLVAPNDVRPSTAAIYYICS